MTITRDDLLRMAQEARWIGNVEGWTFNGYEELERFAALVAAHEREACARVCDEVADDLYMDSGAFEEVYRCANNIRARSNV